MVWSRWSSIHCIPSCHTIQSSLFAGPLIHDGSWMQARKCCSFVQHSFKKDCQKSNGHMSVVSLHKIACVCHCSSLNSKSSQTVMLSPAAADCFCCLFHKQRPMLADGTKSAHSNVCSRKLKHFNFGHIVSCMAMMRAV